MSGAIATAAVPPVDGSTETVPGHWDDLGSFVRYLEQRGELRRITQELDPGNGSSATNSLNATLTPCANVV